MNAPMRARRKRKATWKTINQLDMEMVFVVKEMRKLCQYPEFTGCHGPTQLLAIDAKPVDFIDLLFPEQLWTLIAQVYCMEFQGKF